MRPSPLEKKFSSNDIKNRKMGKIKMKTSHNNEGTIEIIGGVTRSFLSRIPIIKEAIAGAEPYKQHVFKGRRAGKQSASRR
jgi:hypothetical protein